MSSEHVIVVEKLADFRWEDSELKVITADQFVAEEPGARGQLRKVTNLCRTYGYLSMGYYCSLLAEARGDRVTPSVDTILSLQRKRMQPAALAQLNRLIGPLKEIPRSVNTLTLHVFFGVIEDPALAALARKSFELFRCPLMEITLERQEQSLSWQIGDMQALDLRDVDTARDEVFVQALRHYTRRSWRPMITMPLPRMDLAVLHDPTDPLPPSNLKTLKKLVDIGLGMGIAVELIEKKDFSRLTQFDALFIRETTAVTHHTFQFAKKAVAEGMPVIDDPVSILRCTNKAFLAEILRENSIATPMTQMASRRTIADMHNRLTYPLVVKVPDGAFSRNVKKADSFEHLQDIAKDMLKESEIILLQEYMYTDFDWRIGVLAGQPVFAAKYFMCDGHWQILQHADNGKYTEGRVQAVPLNEVPPEVLHAAVSSTRLVGNSFYGVDLKSTPSGVFVIEINDNPNLDVGVEDAALGDALYVMLLSHFLKQVELRFNSSTLRPITQGAPFLALAAG
ncbi:RimK family protein [Acidovorax sp. ACV01]|uniref:RimK family protein n=1 Tax=Acidovorax sp. ACV01 TaxID=2769311 RepID=UPI001785E21A|nr:RimK family protein [Acidovorax sp. ACV01]MBD9394084.1 RimK family protein [Acidovorax sp. ACV01]